MKRIGIAILYVILTALPGFGQQKITRIIHQSDYLDYGTKRFHEITTGLYLLAIAGKISCYKDSMLNSAYTIRQAKDRGSYYEKVRIKEPKGKTKDTLVYLTFDYVANPIRLEVWKDNEPVMNYNKTPIALCYNDSGKNKVLFYMNSCDASELDNNTEIFLMNYLGHVSANEKNFGWFLVNQDSIDTYVMEEYSMFVKVLRMSDPRHFKRFVSDRLIVSYPVDSTPAIFNSPGMKLDSNVNLGIIVTEEYEGGWDTVKIARKSIGLCADILMTGSALYDVPLYYLSYTDAWLAFGFFNDWFMAGLFNFMTSVSDNQFINRASEESKN